MDIVRSLLLNIEQASPVDWSGNLTPDNVTEREALFHMEMMHDGGLFKGIEVPDLQTGTSRWLHIRLSWQGADFVDSVRDPEVWEEAKKGANAAGGFTLELIGELAKGLVKTKITKHTGIEFK